jgi:hypothetical protein
MLQQLRAIVDRRRRGGVHGRLVHRARTVGGRFGLTIKLAYANSNALQRRFELSMSQVCCENADCAFVRFAD